jgi:hypothetical protein
MPGIWIADNQVFLGIEKRSHPVKRIASQPILYPESHADQSN